MSKKSRDEIKVAQPESAQEKKVSTPDFTERALTTSSSKRVVLLKFCQSLKLEKDKPEVFKLKEVLKECKEKYVKDSLLPKISRYCGNTFRLIPKKVETFEKLNGAKVVGVTEVEASLR